MIKKVQLKLKEGKISTLRTMVNGWVWKITTLISIIKFFFFFCYRITCKRIKLIYKFKNTNLKFTGTASNSLILNFICQSKIFMVSLFYL